MGMYSITSRCMVMSREYASTNEQSSRHSAFISFSSSESPVLYFLYFNEHKCAPKQPCTTRKGSCGRHRSKRVNTRPIDPERAFELTSTAAWVSPYVRSSWDACHYLQGSQSTRLPRSCHPYILPSPTYTLPSTH